VSKKLYRVQATLDVLVYADSPDEAEFVATSEAIDELTSFAVESDGDLPSGWTSSTLVYQQGGYNVDDLTVADALAKVQP
jgi:hypothetical protein